MMDNTTSYYNNGYNPNMGQYGYNPNWQQPYGGYNYGGYNNGYTTYGQPYMGTPMDYNNIGRMEELTQNSLTAEEENELKRKPASAFNLNISHEDSLRAMCSHKSKMGDPVHTLNDGSNNVICDICGTIWNPEILTRPEVEELVNALVSQMENDKALGTLPTEVIRDYYLIIAMLKKYPDLHEYAMNCYNKIFNNQFMRNAAENNTIGMYNTLMGNAPAPYYPNQYGYNPGQYGMPQQGYFGQNNIGQYGQNPYMAPQMANPNVNPMQAQPYGMNPQAPNQQFTNQANNMMGGTLYQQQPYAPQPQGQMNQQNQPQAAPPVYTTPQATTTTPNGSVVNNQPDGTVTSDTRIDL